MKKIHFLSFVLILLLSPGCTRKATYYTNIDNQSAYDLTFYFTDDAAILYGDSVVVLSGENKEINKFETPQPTKNFNCETGILPSNVNVTVEGGLLLTKNIGDEDNWGCTSNKNHTIWTMEITFIDSDFQ